MAGFSYDDPPPEGRNGPPTHITHRMGCGCLRWSDGKYTKDKANPCPYPHKDERSFDAPHAPMVDFACGCRNYCRCGAEEKLRTTAKETT